MFHLSVATCIKEFHQHPSPQSQLEIILSTFSNCDVYINPSSDFVFIILLLGLSFKKKNINGRKKVHECSLAFSLQNVHSELFGENSQQLSFPSYSCLPTHPVSVKWDFGNSYRLFVPPNFSMISLLPQHTDHPSHTWNLRQHTIQFVFRTSFNTEATRNLSLFPAQSHG